jgi:hypothetical protein
MTVPFFPATLAEDVVREHARTVEQLGAMCGLEPGRSADACERRWCGYFDGTRHRCGLLIYGVRERLGEEAFRWFVAHRTPEPAPDDAEALYARVGSL